MHGPVKLFNAVVGNFRGIWRHGQKSMVRIEMIVNQPGPDLFHRACRKYRFLIHSRLDRGLMNQFPLAVFFLGRGKVFQVKPGKMTVPA